MRHKTSSKRSSKKADCGRKAIYVRMPTNQAKIITEQNQMVRAAGATGWLAQEMKKGWGSNKVVVPVDGIKYATISGGNLLNWNYKSYAQFVAAAENVLLGESGKEAPAPSIVVAATPTVLALTQTSVGALVQFSDSQLNADYRKILMTVSGTGIAGYTVAVTPCSNSFSILLFALSNNAGQATLRAPSDFTVTIAADEARADAFFSVESLSNRDFLSKAGVC